MAMKLYVGNLSFNTSSEDLRDLFSQAGTVESASVVEDRDTGRSRGFGFVEMATREEGEAAIQQLNGREVGGRNLNVNEAKPREDRGGSRGGGGGGRGGYGGGGSRYERPPACRRLSNREAPGRVESSGRGIFGRPPDPPPGAGK